MTDVVIIGAGHAGCEAAYALAKKGKSVKLLVIDKEHVAKMPCNPSIGGPAKGIVVREIDALGGLMPKIADKTALQFKMLNTTKGPGVWSLRTQNDKLAYSKEMRKAIEAVPKIELIEDIAEELIVEDHKVVGVHLEKSGDIYCKAVILTTGTYLDSSILVSKNVTKMGPDGDRTTSKLSVSLRKEGLRLFRLKTGTPPRIKTSSIDFSKTKEEKGTDEFITFSDETKEIKPYSEQLPCFLTYTTKETLDIINENLSLSSMYSGVVKGVGPRYCPSIEDKVVRFADKDRHQIFLEPESLDLDTTYIQGFSTSMPYDVQEKMVHSLIGLENAVFDKYAYAIEYDAVDPLDVKIDLESKYIENLFFAGQILGTSGYEEAAGLGVMAGINCALKLDGKKPFVLRRDEAYIGVMIDDLIYKGTKEPYRLLTSRAEYRLLLRHDNADQRLSGYAYELGLISKERYENVKAKIAKLKDDKERLKAYKIAPDAKINNYLEKIGETSLNSGVDLYSLLKRPKVHLRDLDELYDLNIGEKLSKQNDIEIKYEGYIDKAKKEANRMVKLEKMRLDPDIDYTKVDNLSLEARQKLNEARPLTIGQASRISGINPSDLQVLAIYMKEKRDANK